MDVSIIGLAGSGKTTLMEAMSGLSAGQNVSKSGLLSIRVPDSRVNTLSEIYKPKKTTFAEFRLQEIPWTRTDESNRKSAAEKYVKGLAGADLLIHVVRSFESPFLADAPDPKRDIDALDAEMVLADLVACENFFERHKKKPAEPNLIAVMEKAKEALEAEQFLCNVDLSENEKKLIAGFGFATMVRQLIVINQPEDGGSVDLEDSSRRIVAVPLSIAKEVAELPEEEQMDFLSDFGFSEPLVNQISKEAYALMNYISFFTVGEDEVRAWTITDGTAAQQAAGKIHSDLERGFIRAQVVGYDTFLKLGSMKACKDAGKRRAEGKGYIVEDGDIIEVFFNV